MNKYLPRAIALCLLSSGGAASAAEQGGVVARFTVVKVTSQSHGQRTLKTRRTAEPGDIVEYRITYRNTTHEWARKVVGTLAIPDGRLSYVPDSAMPLIVEVSVDGRTFTPAPMLRLVVREDGRGKMEPVPASEYRFLRWQLGDLPPQGSTTVSARLRVEDLPVVVVSNTSRS